MFSANFTSPHVAARASTPILAPEYARNSIRVRLPLLLFALVVGATVRLPNLVDQPRELALACRNQGPFENVTLGRFMVMAGFDKINPCCWAYLNTLRMVSSS